MYCVLQTAWLLATVVRAALALGTEPKSEKNSLEFMDDPLAGLDSVKQDAMAGIAAMNQQIYQAVQAPAQYRKCSPSNIQVRREW